MTDIIRKKFQKAAATYDDAAILANEVGKRLLERLDPMTIQPTWIVDVGANTGEQAFALKKRFKKAKTIAFDIAIPMLNVIQKKSGIFRKIPCVCGDAGVLPFKDQSIDMVFSNLTMPWVTDLLQTFTEIQRVLKPNGLFIFSTYGVDTLKELRDCFASVDHFQHVNPFTDMHDVGDALVRAGLADPVMDVERIILKYEDTQDLVRDLRHTGANVVLGESKRKTLTGKRVFKAMNEAYNAYADKDGRIPATYEIVYGHAFGTDVMAQASRGNGDVVIPLNALRSKLR